MAETFAAAGSRLRAAARWALMPFAALAIREFRAIGKAYPPPRPVS